MRRLDLLVPHWKETPEEMEPLLDSVAMQQGVDLSDVGVIVAYDGPDATPLPVGEWAERYPFAIEHAQAPRGGVSATRNWALDMSEAELVMFCDADDCFYSVTGIFIVLQQFDLRGYDVLVSTFMEQTKGENGLTFVTRENDTTFVHGKAYRRGYLVDNGIRFDPRLTVHEDSYFQVLARELCDPTKAVYCPYVFYLWKWRDNSTCRHDPLYILKTFGDMISSSDALVDEFVRRMREDKAAAYAAFMILDAYYAMNKPEWLEVNHREYRDVVEKRFAEYYRKHRQKWESLTPQDRALMSNVVRQRSVGEGMLMEAVTIDQWLERITEHVYDSRPKEGETVV